MAAEAGNPAESFMVLATNFWKERGGRMTFVREIICQCIEEGPSAFDAEELLRDAKRKDPGISIASVYRTLSDLTEAGLLNEIHSPRDQKSYVRSDSRSVPTGHLICKDCQRIFPLNDQCLGLREGSLLRELGFKTGGMHLQIEAACESLERCGSCDKPSRG